MGAHPGPVVLGWRLVPGLELSYQSTVRLVLSQGEVRRSEAWTYLVREVSRKGTALLEARLVGLGAGIEGEPSRHPTPPPRPRAQSLDLRLAMDGRLEGFHPTDFGAGWPHHALGLRLPERALHVYDEWPDAQLVRPFSSLFPLESRVQLSGRSRLRGLDVDQGSHRALLSSEGRLSTPQGLSVRVQGAATWNADRGVLERRSLSAWTEPASTGGRPGRLEIQIAEQGWAPS